MLNQLPRDVIYRMSLDFDYPEILILCKQNSRYNGLICQNDAFWRDKIMYEFGHPQTLSDLSNKEYYKFLTDYKNGRERHSWRVEKDVNLFRLFYNKEYNERMDHRRYICIAANLGLKDIVDDIRNKYNIKDKVVCDEYNYTDAGIALIENDPLLEIRLSGYRLASAIAGADIILANYLLSKGVKVPEKYYRSRQFDEDVKSNALSVGNAGVYLWEKLKRERYNNPVSYHQRNDGDAPLLPRLPQFF